MVLVTAMTTTGVAIAAATGSSDPVSGKFDVTLADPPPTFTPCGKQAVAVLKARFVGTATSSDPRLAGKVTMRLRGVTDEDGPGATVSTVSIRNPNTGRLTADGTFTAVRTSESISGVLDVDLHPSGHAVAVIGLRLEPTEDTPSGFHLVGEYGADKAAPASGVVTEGC
jgi:hypothetical protein